MRLLRVTLLGQVQTESLKHNYPRHRIDFHFIGWPSVAIVAFWSFQLDASHPVAQRTLSGTFGYLLHLGFNDCKRPKLGDPSEINIGGRASLTVSHQQRRPSFEHPLIGSRLKDSLQETLKRDLVANQIARQTTVLRSRRDSLVDLSLSFLALAPTCNHRPTASLSGRAASGMVPATLLVVC